MQAHQPVMRARYAIPVVAVLLSCLVRLPIRAASQDQSFAFLAPGIEFSDDERQRLDGRDVVLRVLPASGHELAAVAAGSLAVGSDAFLASARNIVALKKNQYVPQIGKFSTPPRMEDVQTLTLDEVDIAEIARCSPERCGLKLSAAEVAVLQPLAVAADGPDAKAALNREFRRAIVERAQRYLNHGDATGAPEFTTLLQNGAYVRARMPHLAAYLERFPHQPLPDAESFLYWSKETYAWKPMISVTHVTLMRGDGQNGSPEAMVVSRDIFATRYTSGSFVLSLLFRDVDTPGRHYLVYVNRTWVDALRGLWRPFVEHRLRGQAQKVFAATRDRIERSGGAMNAAAR